MRVSAIVVGFGKPALLAGCLSRLEGALAAVDGETELIVVLNDDSASVADLPRRALVLHGSPELGYAGAVAAGLRLARGEWIALVNDDCLVDVGALAEMVAVGARDDDVGSVAARILFAERPGILNSAGLEIDDLGVARERALGHPAAPAASEPIEVFGASATLGLYRRTMLESLGGLDVSFFAYLEDADLAWRARMAGWRCLLAPRAFALHHHSSTLGHGSGSKHFLVARNRVRMLAKNATAPQLRRGLIRIVAYDLLYVGYAAVTGRTLSPLTGRIRGLVEVRAYRAAGRAGRVEIALPRSPGLRAALGRNRIYRRNTGTTAPARAPLDLVPDEAGGRR